MNLICIVSKKTKQEHRKIKMSNKYIDVVGAREHNLKNISVKIPRDKLTVITGVSGSGKSSLAFDTIYAEGQRRYVESLSAYARQFLDMMKKPDIDSIEGLSPSISIEQKTTSKNPRSTVGTITEIYDYMRLLWARVGTPYSPATGKPIEAQSVSNMVDGVMKMEVGSKILVLSPIVRGRKGEYRKEIQDLQKQGFQRIKIDGDIYDIEDAPTLNKKIKHNIEIVVDRLIVKETIIERLTQSIETALRLSDGLLYIENMGTNKIDIYSQKFACPVSGFTLEEIEPRMFSFNSPYGACPNCDGIGQKLHMNPDLIVPDKSREVAKAIEPWNFLTSTFHRYVLRSLCEYFGVPIDTPFNKLSKELTEIILYGSGNKSIPIKFKGFTSNKPFEGVIPNLERRILETESEKAKERFAQYQTASECEVCHGKRLNEKALCVKIDGLDIIQATEFSISQSLKWFKSLDGKFSKQKQEIASKILKEIIERLEFLDNVGINYLTLSRMSGTLSGGEAQRIRLASQIGSKLTGVLYVLDEPSIGLHQRDNDKLLATLTNLRDIGNSVIVVEHDEDAIREADFVIDMGPKAGIHGGEVVAKGSIDKIIDCDESLTGQYLTGKKKIEVPTKRRKGNGKKISIIGAEHNNLKKVRADIPLGAMTCVTGVSGSGKSSLIIEILYKALANKIYNSKLAFGKHKEIKGYENIDKIIDIDQSPIGKTPRSNPATYTGLFSPIREWFAELPEAKARGYKAGRFSFNVKGGRCEACKGDGVKKIEMHFLPDVYVECDECHGKRFNRDTLEIKYKGKNISDVLEMSVDEAYEFFQNIPTIKNKLEVIKKVGLGYIKLGQPATTLSGGEAQRIKLSKELSKRSTGKTLYILDEPTTGLHFDDINKLLKVLHSLVDKGNSVVVIEHNLDVIKTADYIIDVGPDGGDKGGKIIAKGTPEEISKAKESFTGKYLKKYI